MDLCHIQCTILFTHHRVISGLGSRLKLPASVNGTNDVVNILIRSGG